MFRRDRIYRDFTVIVVVCIDVLRTNSEHQLMVEIHQRSDFPDRHVSYISVVN